MTKAKLLTAGKRLPLLALSIAAALNAQAADWANVRTDQQAPMNSVADIEVATNSVMNLERRWVTRRGVEFARWTQIYQGMPIYGETLVTRDGADGSFKATGFALMGLTDDVAQITVNVTADQAVEAVKNRNNNPQSDGYVELVIDQDSIETTMVIYRGAEGDAIAEGDTTKAWSVSYLADKAGGGEPRRVIGLVDARDGTLIKEPFNAIGQAKQATGPGGNQKIGGYTYGQNGLPTLTLDDNCRFNTPTVRTVDLNGGTQSTLR